MHKKLNITLIEAVKDKANELLDAEYRNAGFNRGRPLSDADVRCVLESYLAEAERGEQETTMSNETEQRDHLDGTHKAGWSDMLGILQDGSRPREE